jgi:hypothetical protein
MNSPCPDINDELLLEPVEYVFSQNSQSKHYLTLVDVDILSYFGMGNWYLLFVSPFSYTVCITKLYIMLIELK